MNEKQTTMDDRNDRGRSGTPFVKKKKKPCEEIISSVSQKHDLLDQPLSTFTVEEVREAAEHLRTILNVLQSLPSETLQKPISSYDTIIQGLQNTIVELTLALDQRSLSENKASFYTHLLLSQRYFASIFAHHLLEANACGHVNTDPEPTNSINFSTKPRSLFDISQTILPDIYDLIQNPGSVGSTQYEQAIANLQTVNEVLEKQKRLLKGLRYSDNNEYAALCCRLGVILAYASELLRQLVHSLATLQTQPRSKSRRSVQLREEALYRLTLFIHNFDDILQKTKELNLLQSREHFQHGDTNRAPSEKILYLHGTDSALTL